MSKSFTLWTQVVCQTVASDGVWNYGLYLNTVMWSQPRWGGIMRIFSQDGKDVAVSSHVMGRRDA